ncbi:unnamed protein product [Strongylus vulgaris]|uniref:Uncharacterized protein n=1 Tax=Strongylus vulgaris TaxID=40348 RepID=A0A3P7JD47_STRVU|nr:unnamed protein product [Strongylus vulgaris]
MPGSPGISGEPGGDGEYCPCPPRSRSYAGARKGRNFKGISFSKARAVAAVRRAVRGPQRASTNSAARYPPHPTAAKNVDQSNRVARVPTRPVATNNAARSSQRSAYRAPQQSAASRVARVPARPSPASAKHSSAPSANRAPPYPAQATAANRVARVPSRSSYNKAASATHATTRNRAARGGPNRAGVSIAKQRQAKRTQ